MPAAFEPGDRLGSFELRRPLGRGAFGEVWLALAKGDLDFSKQVAVKIFPHYATRSEDHYESLLNEARLVGHLKHPNVVDVYRAGIAGDHAWIAMEYLAGRTLSEVLEHSQHKGLWIPRSVLVDIAVLLAEALHYAHTARDHEGEQLGIIHRDLKLANVMVSPDFGLKVLDVTKELCSLTTCPIKPGSHTITGVRTTISCPAVALFGCMPVVALHGV